MSSRSSPIASVPQATVAFPQLRTAQAIHSLRAVCQHLAQAISNTGGLRFQAKPRRLKLQETVQLGDKRFVAILRVDGDEFLLGGGSAGVSILGQLHPDAATAAPLPAPFAAILESQLMHGARTQEDLA